MEDIRKIDIHSHWREPDGFVHPEGLRAIAGAMFDVCHQTTQDGGDRPAEAVLTDLALLSGMASGVLLQIADKMEKGWGDE